MAAQSAKAWLVLAAVAVGVALAAHGSAARVASGGSRELTGAQRAAGLTFDASVDPESRALIEQAIAGARPEAQRLIAEVDGLATITVAQAGTGALGSTRGAGDHFAVVLDLGDTLRSTGRRGISRLVLHELGHVVDFVLVPAALDARLDAAIPAGLPCPAGTPLGSCAPAEERFAETFAKWAMGNDIGANLYIGYAVPPPASFDAWAAPLVDLVR
ncbi:MAG: hypothetical protein QOI80_3539 [Solirubrobacteraceae bacterium]|nr:hypothetical protein [Solirubrobacteraceae bacterium]